jgi:poly-gamma-glutamate capsule biosynthesis protein CapA/YwtB (metallophosphatase superfamily)
MDEKRSIMFAVGDLIFDSPEADSLAVLVEPTLATGDVVVGHLEVLFTARGVRQYAEVPAPPCDPKHMGAVAAAHFNVLTLSGNHVWDSGEPGIEDTIELLKHYGILYTGAGMNIEEARHPALMERKGTRIGFLSYNCIGPRESWAMSAKPGCAYVNVLTHYEQGHVTPGSPPLTYTFAEPGSLNAMMDDIRNLRTECDILVVSLHKGEVHTPVTLGMYEQPVSYAAVDAGADLVLGSHAHILKGIEMYKGKVIFHGLGNFITVTKALTEAPNWNLAQWIERRKRLFGFEPDPEYPTYPFHPEAKQTIIAKCIIERKRIARVSYIPCMVNPKGQPEILKDSERARQVSGYMEKITREAGLNARFAWDGDEVVVC